LKNKKLWIIACAIILVIGSVYYFSADNDDQQQTAQDAGDTKPVFIGNEIIEEENGKRLWELKAERTEIDPQTKAVKMLNLKGTFYKDDGSSIQIIAPEANIDLNSKDILMVGNVKAITSDGATFTAREARWEGKKRYFYGTGGVTMTREDTVITGDKIESDANMEKVKVEGNARVVKGGAPK
jgi:LPS export ABC transporter protein LptC